MTSRLLLVSSFFSLALLAWLFSQLHWQSFLSTLQGLEVTLLPVVALCVVSNIAWRALRWNFVSTESLRLYPAFWQAASIGYLGNVLYPARAGEVLRMVALSYFSPIAGGHAMSSAVLDRMQDMMAFGFLLLLVIALHGEIIAGVDLRNSVMVLMFIALLCLGLIVHFAAYFHRRLQGWNSPHLWRQRLSHLLQQAFQGLQATRKNGLFSLTLLMSLMALGFDAFYKWLMLLAFGWDLPYFAGLLTVSFILLGNSLPSAPAYIGVYEAACVLALSFYGISSSDALAYALVIHLTEILVIVTQGSMVMLYKGLSLNSMRQNKQPPRKNTVPTKESRT